MKSKLLLPILALSLATATQAQEKTQSAPPTQSTQVIDQSILDKVSYYNGFRMAEDILNNGFNVSVESLAAGLKDGLAKRDAKYSEAEFEAAMTTFSEYMQKKQATEQAEAGKVNAEEGAKFLAENAKKEGVKVTESGLQYEVIKLGTGPKPKASDTVKVHYEGTLLDKTVFDSSIQRGEPIEFPLNGVIPGWTEGVQLMPVGSKFKFFIPSKLAYGERGAGATIKSNATLIFEVELLEIAK